MKVVQPSYGNACAFADCTAYGACATDAEGAPVCLCEVGYTGASCGGCEPGFHVDFQGRCAPDRSCAEQETDPCGAHGTCGDSDGVIECTCDPGYEGPRCNLCQDSFGRNERDDCLPLVLGPKPETEEPEEPEPEEPDPPEPPPHTFCAADTCNGNGQCGEAQSGAVCACNPGYGGARCAACADGFRRDEADACVPVEVCTPDLCSGHGTCVDSSGLAVCECEAGYTGTACEACAAGFHLDPGGTCLLDQQCLPSSCSGHGACTVASGVTTCACETGYAQPGCERCAAGFHRTAAELCVPNEVCMPDSCGRGTCDASSGIIVCGCPAGYVGARCEACANGYRQGAAGECIEIICTRIPGPLSTFEGMVGFPPSYNTCQTGIAFNTTRITMTSKMSKGNIWSCGPSTLYPLDSKHIMLEADARPAQLVFGATIGTLRFDYAAYSALALDARGDGVPVGQPIIAERHGGGTVAYVFPTPITVFELTARNSALNQVAIDNVMYDYSTCN